MNGLVLGIVAADPLVRAGLASLLAPQPDLSVLNSSEGALGTVLHQADVLLWDVDAELEPPPFAEIPLPVLALISEEDEAARSLAAGAAGVLGRDSSADQLAAAVRALYQGLSVMEPAFIETFVSSQATVDVDVEDLTPRESEVLQLLSEGLSNKAIAKALKISDNTVKFHVNALLSKFGVGSRTEVVVRAIQAGLVIL